MTKVLAEKVLDAEVLPHKKAAERKSGRKVPCPANVKGNGAHVYGIFRYEVENAGYDDTPRTFHSKMCVGCGKRVWSKGLWHYTGEVFQTKHYADMMDYIKDEDVWG